jgi:hypothetical protein
MISVMSYRSNRSYDFSDVVNEFGNVINDFGDVPFRCTMWIAFFPKIFDEIADLRNFANCP